MCIDAHISSSSSQTLVFSVWDVSLGLWVNVFFCQAKVNYVDGMLPFGAWSAHQEILRLHISIDQASGVDKLHTCYLRSEEGKTSTNTKKYSNKRTFFELKTFVFTNCMAIIRTVFREKVRSQRSKRSSKLGPSSSRTIALYFPHGPK